MATDDSMYMDQNSLIAFIYNDTPEFATVALDRFGKRHTMLLMSIEIAFRRFSTTFSFDTHFRKRKPILATFLERHEKRLCYARYHKNRTT